MTVTDLIAELRRLPPDLPVRVLLSQFIDDDGSVFDLHEGDSLPLYSVRAGGGYVLLTGD